MSSWQRYSHRHRCSDLHRRSALSLLNMWLHGQSLIPLRHCPSSRVSLPLCQRGGKWVVRYLVPRHQAPLGRYPPTLGFSEGWQAFPDVRQGGRKPSEMMAAMLETHPRDEEKTNLASSYIACQWRLGSCWPWLTTNTQRHWWHRWMRYGPSRTTQPAAVELQLYRRIQSRILCLPSRETGGVVLGDLLRLKDNISGCPFLVDTGEKMSEELSGCRFEWTFFWLRSMLPF